MNANFALGLAEFLYQVAVDENVAANLRQETFDAWADCVRTARAANDAQDSLEEVESEFARHCAARWSSVAQEIADGQTVLRRRQPREERWSRNGHYDEFGEPGW